MAQKEKTKCHSSNSGTTLFEQLIIQTVTFCQVSQSGTALAVTLLTFTDRYFTQKVSTFQTARLYQHLRGLKKKKSPQTLFENISTGHFQSTPRQSNRCQYNGQPEGFSVQTFRTFLLANQIAGTYCWEFRNPWRLSSDSSEQTQAA